MNNSEKVESVDNIINLLIEALLNKNKIQMLSLSDNNNFCDWFTPGKFEYCKIPCIEVTLDKMNDVLQAIIEYTTYTVNIISIALSCTTWDENGNEVLVSETVDVAVRTLEVRGDESKYVNHGILSIECEKVRNLFSAIEDYIGQPITDYISIDNVV